jgi:hypothetical protein
MLSGHAMAAFSVGTLSVRFVSDVVYGSNARESEEHA